MSFDLHIAEHEAGRPVEQVVAAVMNRLEGELAPTHGQPTGTLGKLLAELHLVYPPLSALSDDLLDESPWAAEPEVGSGLLTLSLRWSIVGSTALRVIQIAGHCGMGVYDPQADIYYFQDVDFGKERYEVECPHLFTGVVASRQLLQQIVPRLMGKEDPYIVVSRNAEDYAQALWTTAGFRLEYREGSADRHFASESLVEGARVVELLSKFTEGDPGWRNSVEFTRVQF